MSFSASSMQGWRIDMEDAHTALLSLQPNKQVSLFAVFDGHCGSNVANYCGSKLHLRILKEPAFEQGDFKTALKRSFLGLDTDMLADPDFLRESSGCAAVAALISEDWRLIAANAGDSRIILSANGVAIPLSFDHKPNNEIELKRIKAAGGMVKSDRVNGNLALSRAIGDFSFKKNADLPAEAQIITANPDIIERQLEITDEFIVLACDGIWDCMTCQNVVDFVRLKVSEYNGDLDAVSEGLMEFCLAPEGDVGTVGCDNMTVVIVAILRDMTMQEWTNNIIQKVKDTGLIMNLRNIAAEGSELTMEDLLKEERSKREVSEEQGDSNRAYIPDRYTEESPERILKRQRKEI